MAGESDEQVAAHGGGLSSVRVVVRRNENKYESRVAHHVLSASLCVGGRVAKSSLEAVPYEDTENEDEKR